MEGSGIQNRLFIILHNISCRITVFQGFSNQPVFCFLKALTNKKRYGLTLVLFDTSRSKLFTRRFSNKSVQAASYMRGLKLLSEPCTVHTFCHLFLKLVLLVSHFAEAKFFSGREREVEQGSSHPQANL